MPDLVLPDQLHRHRHRLLITAATLVAGLVTVLSAVPASAHDELQSTAPADGARAVAPTSVTLTFVEPVLNAPSGNRMVVTGPSGPVAGTFSVQGAVVSTTFEAPLPPASYLVAWRVVSDDGHPVSGTFRFTSVPGSASPTPTSTAGAPTTVTATPVASAQSAHAHEHEAGGPGRVLLLVLIVAAALCAGTIVLAKRRQGEGQ